MKKEGILFSVFAPVFKSGLNLMKIHIDHMSIYKHYKTIAMYCYVLVNTPLKKQLCFCNTPVFGRKVPFSTLRKGLLCPNTGVGDIMRKGAIFF